MRDCSSVSVVLPCSLLRPDKAAGSGAENTPDSIVQICRATSVFVWLENIDSICRVVPFRTEQISKKTCAGTVLKRRADIALDLVYGGPVRTKVIGTACTERPP